MPLSLTGINPAWVAPYQSTSFLAETIKLKLPEADLTRRMRTGQWVEVRPKEEILCTLDKRGQLEGLPFMPQMFNYCSQRFRVYKVAHKTCDSVPVNGAIQWQSRKMREAVHLEGLRCDGAAYGGCHAGCLIFWKEAWLKTLVGEQPGLPKSDAGCNEEDVRAGTRSVTIKDSYVCQATQLSAATSPLSAFDLKQYIEDYRSGNVGLWRMCCGFIYVGYSYLCNAGLKVGRPLRWFYDFFQGLYGGVPYPRRAGVIPVGKATPVEYLNLQSGEWVRVKSYKEILVTLDKYRRNRGMLFDAAQVPYCGRIFRVLKRVDQIIDERSGKMIKLKTPAIILDGVVCESRYSECRLFCPRSIYSYWREIWLERVAGPGNRLSYSRLLSASDLNGSPREM